jgi:kinesin family protein 2/24
MANTSSSGNNSANSNAVVSVWQKNNLVNVQRSRNNNADGYYNNNANDEDEDPRIRVVVRARPLAPREIAKNERNVCDADPDSKTLTVFEPKVKVDLTKFTETSEFVFDDVFGGYCSDDRVYDKTVGPLVRSVLCGGNATCFAYGQTGSGKTYTMAPLPTRAAKELLSGFAEFNKVFEEEKKKNECPENGLNDAAPTSPNNEEDVGQKIELWVSAYEIYGGKVYDLLASREKLRVLEDAKNQMQIVGLSEFLCENVSEVETLIERSALERCVGQTGANAESSRSHAVIQLWIKERLLPTKARNGRQKSIYQRQQQHDLMMNSHRHPQLQNKRYHRKPLGKFSFIDLAGSERGADTTDTDRQTRAEGAEINKSLLALKECIRALDGGDTRPISRIEVNRSFARLVFRR